MWVTTMPSCCGMLETLLHLLLVCLMHMARTICTALPGAQCRTICWRQVGTLQKGLCRYFQPCPWHVRRHFSGTPGL